MLVECMLSAKISIAAVAIRHYRCLELVMSFDANWRSDTWLGRVSFYLTLMVMQRTSMAV